MGRGKGGGGDDWGKFFAILIGVGLGAVALYYVQAGRGEENAALIPDNLEGRIDLVVERLNQRFGKAWVNLGLDVLERYLKAILPWEVVRLVSIIYHVEQLSKTTRMDGPAKQQTAVNWVQGGIT